MSRKIAKLKRIELPGMNASGTARLFKCSPPVPGAYPNEYHKYVVVSAVSTLSGWETYIFPANRKGEITSWIELNGSETGTLNIESVLTSLGYEIH